MATLRQIQETLDQNNGAQFLVQPVIDRALFVARRAYTPLFRTLPRRSWETPTYIFNTVNNYPQAQFTTEDPPASGTGSVAASASNYVQTSFPIKHWQVNMDLSKFSIQTARVNGNLAQLELDGASKSAVYLREMAYMYGSAGATVNTKRQASDGLDLLIASANKIAGGQVISFAMLDAAIDAVSNQIAEEIGDNYEIVLTPEMYSSLGRQFVQNQRFMGETVVYPRDDRGRIGAPVTDNKSYIKGGVSVLTYRDIPLVKSSFLASKGTMGTVSASVSGSDGSLTAGATYKYYVEVVTDYGVSLACPEVSATPASTNHVALSWTAPAITDTYGNTRLNLFYRIFRTAANGASGTETLYAVVSAYDNNDAAVTAWNDTGAIVNPLATNPSGQALYSVTVASSGGVAVPDGVTTPRTNPSSHVQQDIFIVPRDPDICVVAAVNEAHTEMLALINARTQQMAYLGDETLALRGPAFAAKICGAYVS